MFLFGVVVGVAGTVLYGKYKAEINGWVSGLFAKIFGK